MSKFHFNSELLRNVKLNHVVQEGKCAQVYDVVPEVDQVKVREYFFQAGIDSWYEQLKECTFLSSNVELTRVEASLIVDCWKAQKEAKLNSFDLNKLLELNQRIQHCMDVDFGLSTNEQEYFVKLSTRSPKDSIIAFSNGALML